MRDSTRNKVFNRANDAYDPTMTDAVLGMLYHDGRICSDTVYVRATT